MNNTFNTKKLHPVSAESSLYQFIEIISMLMKEFPISDSVELVDDKFTLRYKKYTFSISRINGVDYTLNRPFARLEFKSIHNGTTVASFISGSSYEVASYLRAEKNTTIDYNYNKSVQYKEWDRDN